MGFNTALLSYDSQPLYESFSIMAGQFTGLKVLGPPTCLLYMYTEEENERELILGNDGSNIVLLPYDSRTLYESFRIMVGQVTTSHVYVLLNEVDTTTRLVSLWLCCQGHLTTGNTVDVNLKRVLTFETV